MNEGIVKEVIDIQNLEEAKTFIEKCVQDNRVILFMKGNRQIPNCGFSAQVVSVLNLMDVEFETFDVLENEYLRQGIKEFSEWPTVPQLYIDGEFVGGCDIVKDLFNSGELHKLLGRVEEENQSLKE